MFAGGLTIRSLSPGRSLRRDSHGEQEKAEGNEDTVDHLDLSGSTFLCGDRDGQLYDFGVKMGKPRRRRISGHARLLLL